jgi:hypothetical protein
VRISIIKLYLLFKKEAIVDEEDYIHTEEKVLSETHQKVVEFFDYDWSEWDNLPHFEKEDKIRIYRRFNK